MKKGIINRDLRRWKLTHSSFMNTNKLTILEDLNVFWEHNTKDYSYPYLVGTIAEIEERALRLAKRVTISNKHFDFKVSTQLVKKSPRLVGITIIAHFVDFQGKTRPFTAGLVYVEEE